VPLARERCAQLVAQHPSADDAKIIALLHAEGYKYARQALKAVRSPLRAIS